MKPLAVFVYTLGMGCLFHTTCTLAVGGADIHKQSGMRRAAKGISRRRLEKSIQKKEQILDISFSR